MFQSNNKSSSLGTILAPEIEIKGDITISDNIIILEWGNLVKDLLPDDMIFIFFEHLELNKRRIFSNYELFSH